MRDTNNNGRIPEDGHSADEPEKKVDVDTMNDKSENASETDDEMEQKAIESEMKIDRGTTNARSIVGDIFRDCYAERSNIRDSSERAMQSWMATICVSILVSGEFLEDVLLKRPDEDAPDKQVSDKKPTGTDSKKSRDNKLDSLSDVDGSTPEHGPDLV